MEAQNALKAFESSKTKTKKQVKKDLEEFPSLDGNDDFIEAKR